MARMSTAGMPDSHDPQGFSGHWPGPGDETRVELETGTGSVHQERGSTMTHKLAARYTATRARLGDAAQRKAEEGMATAEWALVTLCVCAFAVVVLGSLGTFAKPLIEGIISKALSSGK